VVQRVQSLSNPQLKRLKRLHSVESEQEELLVEGTHLLAEAIAVSWQLRSIYYTEKWAIDNRLLLDQIDEGVEQYLVDYNWAGSLSQGHQDWSLVLAADGIQDPGNAGTLLRSVVGFGANRLYLSPDSVSPVHPKFLRSTAGQWFRSPPGVAQTNILAQHAKRIGAKVIVADMTGKSLWDLDFSGPTMFVVGSEGSGVRQEIKDLADEICAIPIAPGVESLNVATAGTIFLYEARRQRRSG
jgi:TrmH family RNA methyltransferase